jgi:glycosyltransferase involved in cell wall biosynthesis
MIPDPATRLTRLPHVLVDARFSSRPRGGDRCRYELASHLHAQASGRYTFLTYDDTMPALLRRSPGARAVATDCRPNQHPRGDLFEHVRLPKLARQLGADIYHGTFNVLPLTRPAAATIVTIHDMAVFAHPEAYGRKFAAYGRVLVRAAIRRATRIIAISDATRREILRYEPAGSDKITVIPNGVGGEFLDAASLGTDRVDEACRRLGVARPYVLFVGNLEPKKNLARLITAFSQWRASRGHSHTLLIVGQRPPKVPDGLKDADDLDNPAIRFAGYVEDADLPVLYRGAELVAYPSIYEGFGMPVLEGMAAGVPVLTSSVSSLPEVAGGCAMLVNPFDVDDIARGLHRALTDLEWRARAVEAGRRRAGELSWEENARRTAAVYHEVFDRAIAKPQAVLRRRRCGELPCADRQEQEIREPNPRSSP